MNSFQWGSCFETGIDEVDEQHQFLVDIINRYGVLVAENNISTQDLQLILFELSQYSEFHFCEEEALMRKTGIHPLHLEKHIKVHRAFMTEIISMQAFVSEEDKQGSELLLNFLIHWLAYHILGIDKNMSRQLAKIKAGVDPQIAYEEEEKSQDSSTEPLLAALKGLFEQVSERNKALLDLNQRLEDMVDERTQQLVMANKQLEELSLTDSLTQLPNRRFAMRQLNQLWEISVVKNEPLVAIMIDVDNFKEVNDTAGHDAGDLVLQEIATMLRHHFRNDDVVCRLGGDEFFIICPNTDQVGGMYVARQAQESISELQLDLGQAFWYGSISVGVAQRDDEMRNYHSLIKAADNAVYRSKSEGRDRVSAWLSTE
ncbi:GGDEF domain-containing protein [Vibrio kasasachensis]|uniref:GGDEF domain-containing protein n=1 Tax=Vibrio kasasachensis TaxID=2910248 RepID=UPI003D0F6519